MEYRVLEKSDAEQFKTLRLEALKNYPEAFGNSYEDEKKYSTAMFEKRIESGENSFTLGAFDNNHLIAIASFYCERGFYLIHRGNIISVYCQKGYQGQGIAYRLMNVLLSKIQKLDAIRVVYLAVNTHNEKALTLYRKLGFVEYGIDAYSLYDQKVYHSELLMQKIVK